VSEGEFLPWEQKRWAGCASVIVFCQINVQWTMYNFPEAPSFSFRAEQMQSDVSPKTRTKNWSLILGKRRGIGLVPTCRKVSFFLGSRQDERFVHRSSFSTNVWFLRNQINVQFTMYNFPAPFSFSRRRAGDEVFSPESVQLSGSLPFLGIENSDSSEEVQGPAPTKSGMRFSPLKKLPFLLYLHSKN